MAVYSFPQTECVRLVQLTDCHLLADAEGWYQGVQPYWQLQQVLHCLTRNWPDAIVLTGDLSQDHSLASYQLLVQLFQAVPVPVFWLPGNHDDAAELSSLLAQPPFLPDKILQGAGWQWLLLDSTGPTPAGYFSASRAQALVSRLQSHTEPCWLFAHHHPRPIGSSIDRHGWQDAATFWQLLARFPQVTGLAHGHCHHGYRSHYQGVALVGCPATSVQFQQSSDWQTQAQGPQWCDWRFYAGGCYEVDFKRMMP